MNKKRAFALTAILALTTESGVADNEVDPAVFGNWQVADCRHDPFNPNDYCASAYVAADPNSKIDWSFSLVAQCHAIQRGNNYPLYSPPRPYKDSEGWKVGQGVDFWQVKKAFTDHRADEMDTILKNRQWLTPDGVHKDAPEGVSKAVEKAASLWPGGWGYLLERLTGADVEINTAFFSEHTNFTYGEINGLAPVDVAFGGPEHKGDVRTLQAFNRHGTKHWHFDEHDQRWLNFRINSSDRMFVRWDHFQTGAITAEFDLNNGKAALSEIRRRCAIRNKI